MKKRDLWNRKPARHLFVPLEESAEQDGDRTLDATLSAHEAREEYPDIPPAVKREHFTEDELENLNEFFAELRRAHVRASIEFMLRLLNAGDVPPSTYERGLRSIILERICPQSRLYNLPWRDIRLNIAGCRDDRLFAEKKIVMAALAKIGVRRAAGLFL